VSVATNLRAAEALNPAVSRTQSGWGYTKKPTPQRARPILHYFNEGRSTLPRYGANRNNRLPPAGRSRRRRARRAWLKSALWRSEVGVTFKFSWSENGITLRSSIGAETYGEACFRLGLMHAARFLEHGVPADFELKLSDDQARIDEEFSGQCTESLIRKADISS
jgi:hypothetical protein